MGNQYETGLLYQNRVSKRRCSHGKQAMPHTHKKGRMIMKITRKEFAAIREYERGMGHINIISVVIPVIAIIMVTLLLKAVFETDVNKGLLYTVIALLLEVVMLLLIRVRKTVRNSMHKLVDYICIDNVKLNKKALHDAVGYNKYDLLMK